MAINQLQGAVACGDELRILAGVNAAGQALYALWSLQGIKGRAQVRWAGDDPERQNIVGLVYARGEADHQGKHAAMAVGFGEAPFGKGPFGGGWLWRELPTERPDYLGSQALYEQQVQWQTVSVPFVRAQCWFDAHQPEVV